MKPQKDEKTKRGKKKEVLSKDEEMVNKLKVKHYYTECHELTEFLLGYSCCLRYTQGLEEGI